jgi:hypothetical protein
MQIISILISLSGIGLLVVQITTILKENTVI